ncbi:acyl carrier protein [Streptomyces sp. NPDC017405]|uniref:acyl carrier protein n=1 Tax=unclassified Streptomyces TaxID=2593676 RepID=UPI0037A88858
MKEFTLADLRQTVAACVGTGNADVVDEASLDVSFMDLGLDSLALYELVTRIQDDLSVSIADEEIDELKTPRLLLGHVNGLLGHTAGQRADA